MSSVDQENLWLELERRERKQGPTALTEGAVNRDASAERSSVYNRVPTLLECKKFDSNLM